MKKVNKGIKGIQKIEAEFRALNKDLRSPEYMRELGEFVSGIIRRNSGQRQGMLKSDGGKRETYKPLSERYAKQRERDRESGKIATEAPFVALKGRASNVTRTGQMRKSIGVKSVTSSTVTVGPKGARNDGKTNEKVAEYVTQGGRPFNALAEGEHKQVKNKIMKDLKTFLRKRLGK